MEQASINHATVRSSVPMSEAHAALGRASEEVVVGAAAREDLHGSVVAPERGAHGHLSVGPGEEAVQTRPQDSVLTADSSGLGGSPGVAERRAGTGSAVVVVIDLVSWDPGPTPPTLDC